MLTQLVINTKDKATVRARCRHRQKAAFANRPLVSAKKVAPQSRNPVDLCPSQQCTETEKQIFDVAHAKVIVPRLRGQVSFPIAAQVM